MCSSSNTLVNLARVTLTLGNLARVTHPESLLLSGNPTLRTSS